MTKPETMKRKHDEIARVWYNVGYEDALEKKPRRKTFEKPFDI
jgi:hypothetical protein